MCSAVPGLALKEGGKDSSAEHTEKSPALLPPLTHPPAARRLVLSHLWWRCHQVRSETEPPTRLTSQQPYRTGGSDASSSTSSTPRTATAAAAAGALNSRNGGATNSLQKLQRVLQLCDECGVIRQPVLLGGLLLVPLLSWHHRVRVGRLGGLPRTSRNQFPTSFSAEPDSGCAAVRHPGLSSAQKGLFQSKRC